MYARVLGPGEMATGDHVEIVSEVSEEVGDR